jgi:predicted  nucleic acid-binding Zn-ribbon protein
MERTVRKVRADARQVTDERDKARSDIAALSEKLVIMAAQLSEAKAEAKGAAKTAAALHTAEKEVLHCSAIYFCNVYV